MINDLVRMMLKLT